MTNKKKRKMKRKRQSTTSRKVAGKIPLLPIVIILAAVVVVGAWGYWNNKFTAETVAQSTQSENVDLSDLKGGETKPVLSPSRFVGKTAHAYKVAMDNQLLLDHMYCYCYCQKTIGHKSLLSCFTDKHAVNCTICQDQALFSKKLADEGLDIAEVRKKVDKKFWKPFS
jgi:hypothetical protein